MGAKVDTTARASEVCLVSVLLWRVMSQVLCTGRFCDGTPRWLPFFALLGLRDGLQLEWAENALICLLITWFRESALHRIRSTGHHHSVVSDWTLGKLWWMVSSLWFHSGVGCDFVGLTANKCYLGYPMKKHCTKQAHYNDRARKWKV